VFDIRWFYVKTKAHFQHPLHLTDTLHRKDPVATMEDGKPQTSPVESMGKMILVHVEKK